jgi:L,D-transpeptidase YcbB
VDDAGKLQLRKDVYGRDATMIAMLKNTRGKDLEQVIAHAQPNYVRPAGNLPSNVNYASDNSGYSSSGPSFFERLFGGPPAPQPPAPIGRRWQQPQQRQFFAR